MNKWIAEFELEDGDTMPEHMDLEYKGAKIDFHCRPMWGKQDAESDVPDRNVGDLISRQAAIARAVPLNLFGREVMIVSVSELENLPSAQPEQRWIPCSERLPEESGRYLISVLDGVGRRTTVAPYQPRYKAWTMTGRMAYWKVIAWMPLPKPWEGEEAE